MLRAWSVRMNFTVPWDQTFFDPIVLPNGRKLITLRDAARYITELPKAEHDAPEWQTAMDVLIKTAERGWPEMFANIAMLRALNRRQPTPAAASRRKRAKAYKIVR
jgi:hypothetical protein